MRKWRRPTPGSRMEATTVKAEERRSSGRRTRARRRIALELGGAASRCTRGVRRPAPGEAASSRRPRCEGLRLHAERLDVTGPTPIAIPANLRVPSNKRRRTTRPTCPSSTRRSRSGARCSETQPVRPHRGGAARRAALREMGGGVVCNITSSSYLAAVPFYAAYRASKARRGCARRVAARGAPAVRDPACSR